MRPFQLERSREGIHSCFNHRREFSCRADGDFRRPITARILRPHNRISRLDPDIRERAENFPEPFEQQSTVIAPPVLIIICHKLGHGRPIFLLDLRQKMGVVELNLAFGLPKPCEVHSHDQRHEKAGVESVSKIHAHPER